MLHLESVAPATLTLAQRLLALPELSEMRLVGGTALALQLGHRTSVDLDFTDANEYTVLRSLTYFDDAEEQPLPVMLMPFDWEEAKTAICAVVEAYA